MSRASLRTNFAKERKQQQKKKTKKKKTLWYNIMVLKDIMQPF
jgi:hypothetical protein